MTKKEDWLFGAGHHYITFWVFFGAGFFARFAKQRAFYYVRVLEIPTPRWTAYDAKLLGAEMPEGTRMYLQERAYTSPIWYTP